MRPPGVRQVGGISGFAFLVLIGTLTALRTWQLEPATPVQSALVWATAILVVAAVGAYAALGGRFVACWLLAAGPSLAFTLNLFVPVSPMGPVLKAVVSLVSAAALSGVLALAGYVLGRGFGTVLRPGALGGES